MLGIFIVNWQSLGSENHFTDIYLGIRKSGSGSRSCVFSLAWPIIVYVGSEVE
jgi:hypothetical protein